MRRSPTYYEAKEEPQMLETTMIEEVLWIILILIPLTAWAEFYFKAYYHPKEQPHEQIEQHDHNHETSETP